MNPSPESPMVYVVDDDAGVRSALGRLFRLEGWAVTEFGSAEEFLANRLRPARGCLILDVNLPGLDGMELQRKLTGMGQALPVIFLTGHGDIPMSVRAMRAGATDFLAKPIASETILAAVRDAISTFDVERRDAAEVGVLRQRLEALTPREREVLQAVAAGRLNKQIANDLGIVEQTVKFHRARLMERMQAGSTAELMHMAARLGIRSGH